VETSEINIFKVLLAMVINWLFIYSWTSGYNHHSGARLQRQ